MYVCVCVCSYLTDCGYTDTISSRLIMSVNCLLSCSNHIQCTVYTPVHTHHDICELFSWLCTQGLQSHILVLHTYVCLSVVLCNAQGLQSHILVLHTYVCLSMVLCNAQGYNLTYLYYIPTYVSVWYYAMHRAYNLTYLYYIPTLSQCGTMQCTGPTISHTCTTYLRMSQYGTMQCTGPTISHTCTMQCTGPTISHTCTTYLCMVLCNIVYMYIQEPIQYT